MAATFKVALADAYRSVPTLDGKRFAQLFTHGSLAIEIYAPREKDEQAPHTRDELYVIAQGSGDFVCHDSQKQEQRVRFAPGDVLFAAAGTPHRFENFADDFFTWVVFYGPEGGEAKK
jgi:mannose-6-phosphate isomerase-like protein (cupin superfamily)